ncbi:MAG: RidA family protein [Acidobacteria bacterium]|nr:RidA family protein [Acidobacteriota bacterium]
MNRTYINLPATADKPPFSDAVLVGDTLYIAGRIGFIPGTYRVPEDMGSEVRNLFDWVRDVLAKAGMTLDHLVSVTVYCPDLSLFESFNAIYKTYFGSDFPSRAFIGSGPLLHGGRFQFQGIAVKQ